MSQRFRWRRILIIASAAVFVALVLFGAMEYLLGQLFVSTAMR